MHHKVAKCVMGVVLVVVGVLLLNQNYHWWGEALGAGETNMLSWFLPALVILMGVKMMLMGCMYMMQAKSMNASAPDEAKKE